MCFFCNDTAPTEIYTLSLLAALPIPLRGRSALGPHPRQEEPHPVTRRELDAVALQPVIGWVGQCAGAGGRKRADRKSTRLNSSHSQISYAVLCLTKKNFAI